MDDKIVKSIELCDTQWHAQSVSVNCGTACTTITQHCYVFTVLFLGAWESSYVATVVSSSFGSIFTQTAGFNMTKTLTIYFLVSFHVLVEENALNFSNAQ